MTCKKCNLHKTAYNQFVGCSSKKPIDILLIADCPDSGSDLIGSIVVSDILRNMLLRAELIHYNIVYSYVVCCRPTNTIGGPYRKPSTDEIVNCIPNVLEIIKTNRPKCMVFIGDLAVKYIKKIPIPTINIQDPKVYGTLGSVPCQQAINKLRTLKEYLV